MYKIKAPDGSNNICGRNLKRIREALEPPVSQRELGRMLQRAGYDLDNHFVRRVELGERFVTDIEIKMLMEVLHISCEELLAE